MEYRRLGSSGLKVSALSFGSWVTFGNQVDDSLATKFMEICYEAGVNFFDNAEVYANGVSEEIMGRVLKKLNWSRDSYIVSSKVFWGGQKPTQRGLSKKHIVDGCHGALKRLQVDYLDLFFCHRPDPETPIEETVQIMNTLIQQGKILYWGTSEWSAQQITEACLVAAKSNLCPPTMEQPEYNLFHRTRVEEEYLPLYKNFGLGTTIWSPLASGILTGKYASGIPKDSRANVQGYQWLADRIHSPEGQEKLKKVSEYNKMAKELDISLTRFAIAWCLKNQNVSTVILGASKIEQLTENLKAMDDYRDISNDMVKRIDEII